MRSGILLVLVFATVPAWSEPACRSQSFGRELKLTAATEIGEIAARPDAFVGREVRVEGEVVEVCREQGCWLEMRAGAGDERLRIKVRDGEIVFPVTARGRHGVAEGTVEVLELSRDEYLGYRQHEAEESGRGFDPASVAEDGPFRVVRLRGVGAEICL